MLTGNRAKSLGIAVMDWRKKQGFSRVEFADHLGVSRQRIWDWETHGIPEHDARLVRLAVRELSRMLTEGGLF